ncbi:MAG: sigma-70 family RNA polymerase sigma factor [Verrucomicrobia bacterium]|nr:sigma-70 family RNA polymerase sigma factor [Verrucomicrobiota bacterium]
MAANKMPDQPLLQVNNVEPSDDSLFEQYRNGDAAAFETLLARHQSALFGFLIRMAGDRALAEDLFQETWVRVVREAGRYRAEQKFSRWLFTIANRLAIDEMRRRKRWKTVSVDDEETTVELSANGPSASVETERRQTLSRIEAALATMQPSLRQVFLLREHSGVSFKEIAAMTDAPLGTVLWRMSAALKHLRKELEADGITE